METVEIGIESPRELAGQRITGERVPVGVPADYKPCVAKLPDGRLLLVAFAPYQLEEGRKREEILLFRSEDGGATWSDAENLTTGHGLLGREPYFTVLRDGTVLMTVHFLSRDVRNPAGYTRSFVHRSADGGHTWSTTVAEPEGVAPGGSSCTTRTVLELDDGSLLLGVGSIGTPYLWRSRDGGATWPERRPTVIEELGDDYPFPFLGEAVWWQAPSGRILVLARLDSQHAGRFAVEVDDPEFGRSDNVDRLILYASDDRGRSFRPVEAFGRPGEMYPAILRLQDGRLLLTFTVRALHRPLGVRAVVGRETHDGFAFDLTRDRLMLDARTPPGVYSGGGFGRTVQLDDGMVVTSYSWRDAQFVVHSEVVRWRLPPAG